MKKRFLPQYVLVLIPVLVIIAAFIAYEVFRYGFVTGLLIVLLTWTCYILCVPAAHGRIMVGALLRMVTKQSWFIEPYFWGTAVFINAVTLVFASDVYLLTIPTHVLLRIFVTPEYWIILIIAAIGVWYRTLIGHKRYAAYESIHTLIRHAILVIGLGVLLYLTYPEMVIMLNTTATG